MNVNSTRMSQRFRSPISASQSGCGTVTVTSGQQDGGGGGDAPSTGLLDQVLNLPPLYLGGGAATLVVLLLALTTLGGGSGSSRLPTRLPSVRRR